MWTEATGVVALADILVELGVELPDNVDFIERVQAISADGLTLGGAVWTSDGVFQAYRLTVPAETWD